MLVDVMATKKPVLALTTNMHKIADISPKIGKTTPPNLWVLVQTSSLLSVHFVLIPISTFCLHLGSISPIITNIKHNINASILMLSKLAVASTSVNAIKRIRTVTIMQNNKIPVQVQDNITESLFPFCLSLSTCFSNWENEKNIIKATAGNINDSYLLP